ncbi:MAG: YbhB/YbcL family Raf kinase inhibitor-like protein, partial [Dehalococcoidia bacterium]|nr:YbhB/YbcL family Raf kinase inhibitor-like protein [Dehalococcoidia bacterium]
FKPMRPLVLYPGIVILFSLVAMACSSGDGQDTPLEVSALLQGLEANIDLTSTEFSNGGDIPAEYTCKGLDRSPPVAWGGVPEGTRSLTLIVDEPDEGHRGHWVIYDLPSEVTELPRYISILEKTVQGGKQGRNHTNGPGWSGPCPEEGGKNEGTYVFNIYALDTVLGIEVEGGARRNDVIRAMEGHVIGYGQLIGKFCRSDAAAVGTSYAGGTLGRGSCPPLGSR